MMPCFYNFYYPDLLAYMVAPGQPAVPLADCVQQLHKLLHLPGEAWQEGAEGGHHLCPEQV